jgi:hypothetical protein
MKHLLSVDSSSTLCSLAGGLPISSGMVDNTRYVLGMMWLFGQQQAEAQARRRCRLLKWMKI